MRRRLCAYDRQSGRKSTTTWSSALSREVDRKVPTKLYLTPVPLIREAMLRRRSDADYNDLRTLAFRDPYFDGLSGKPVVSLSRIRVSYSKPFQIGSDLVTGKPRAQALENRDTAWGWIA